MNNQIKYLMIALVAVISIASCKKEIDYSDPNGNGCQLSSWKVISGSGELVVNLEYDAIGRVVKESTPTGEVRTSVYTNNKITSTDQDGYVDEFILSNGRIISSATEGVVVAGITTYQDTKKYDYNADGYLSQIRSYYNGVLLSTVALTYSDGNLIKTVVTDESTGMISATTTFNYTSQKALINSFASDPIAAIVDYQTGNYFGKPSKNTIASTSYTAFKLNGDLLTKSNSVYAYQVDTKGNATAISITDSTTDYDFGTPSPTTTSVDQYQQTFTCK